MKFANTNRTDNGEGKPLCTCIFIIVNVLTRLQIISKKKIL
jgi:hypothetical protein